jgi:RNA polymerase sigma-70 factor (ECF subfamily)
MVFAMIAGNNHIYNISMNEINNNKAIFSSCIEEHMSSLFQFALKLTKNVTDAEDLVAESVAKAWKAFASLENIGVFRSWMFRIVHNNFVSDYRKKSVRPTETTYDESETKMDNGKDVTSLLFEQPNEFLLWWANPELEFVNNLLAEDIHNAIDELPEVYRTSIILVNIEGMTYDEAANVLGVPTGTVRSRMKRGRTLLQKNLWHHAKDAGLVTDDEVKGQLK